MCDLINLYGRCWWWWYVRACVRIHITRECKYRFLLAEDRVMNRPILWLVRQKIIFCSEHFLAFVFWQSYFNEMFFVYLLNFVWIIHSLYHHCLVMRVVSWFHDNNHNVKYESGWEGLLIRFTFHNRKISNSS